VATLTFVYSDSTAVVGPLATVREPHSWDLCVGHAGRITAPRGWELMRHAAPFLSEPTHSDEDDLVALADAVREGTPSEAPVSGFGGTAAPLSGFAPTATNPAHLQHAGAHATVPSGGLLAPPEHQSGRRRGHLRVLPDPAD
jgi:Protein of unknown function (DUF3499)